MTNQENENQEQKTGSTSPREETKDAAAPPSNPDVDQDAVDKGRENIDKISGN